MALTKEQFQKARQAGYSLDQIVGFEKKRMSSGNSSTEQAEKQAFKEHPFQETGKIIGKNLLGAAKKTYQEVGAPFVHAASALAFDAPRTAAKMQAGDKIGKDVEQAIFPEQETAIGKTLRFGMEAPATVFGGTGRAATAAYKGLAPLAKGVMGTGKVARGVGKTLQAAGSGAAFGLATTKPTKEEYAANVAANTAFGAAAPAAISTIKLGGKVVGYVGSNIGKYISKNVGGITESTRNTINRLGAARVFEPIKASADYISQNVAPRILQKMQTFSDKANQAYKDAVINFKGNTINSQPFYQAVQRGLRQKGWIDLQGNPTIDYKSGLDPVADKLTTLYLRMKAPSEGARLTGKVISKEDFFTYRDVLGSMLREKPSDRLVMEAREALYNSAEKSGMSGIKLARDLEKKMFDIEGKIDIKKITSDLVKAKNPQYTKIIQDEYKDLVKKGVMTEKEYTQIFDDLEAHFANSDFGLVSTTPGQAGGMYPSRAGIIRGAVSEGTKAYYKDLKPAMQELVNRVKGGAAGVKQELEKPLWEAAQKGQNRSIGKALAITGALAGSLALGSQAQAYELPEKPTLGVKNNNPINLKAFDKWDGMTGKDKQGHAQFKDMDYGVRAAIKNLNNHKAKNPKQTLVSYLNSFAEANGTEEAKFIAKKLGIKYDARLKDLNMEDVLIPLAQFESKITITPEDIKRVKEKFKL